MDNIRKPYWDLVDKKAEENNQIDLDAYANGVEDGINWEKQNIKVMKLSKQYNNLDKIVTEAFERALNNLGGSIVFYKTDYYDCPTSYYNDNNGEEQEIYILKIDGEGIHMSEVFGDLSLPIDLSELNGLSERIDITERLEFEFQQR